MSKRNKLRDKLFAIPPPKKFKWNELVTLLEGLGYKLLNNSGSKRKFHHEEADHLVSFHEPHPGDELLAYVVKDAKEAVKVIERWNKK
jgi:predicted RNA binding protein YcfA (HicA-like mRNA interferase family)